MPTPYMYLAERMLAATLRLGEGWVFCVASASAQVLLLLKIYCLAHILPAQLISFVKPTVEPLNRTRQSRETFVTCLLFTKSF